MGLGCWDFCCEDGLRGEEGGGWMEGCYEEKDEEKDGMGL